jgi:hypothetical protein
MATVQVSYFCCLHTHLSLSAAILRLRATLLCVKCHVKLASCLCAVCQQSKGYPLHSAQPSYLTSHEQLTIRDWEKWWVCLKASCSTHLPALA